MTKAFVVDKATTSMRLKAGCEYDRIVEVEAQDSSRVLQVTEDTTSEVAESWVAYIDSGRARKGDCRNPSSLIQLYTCKITPQQNRQKA